MLTVIDGFGLLELHDPDVDIPEYNELLDNRCKIVNQSSYSQGFAQIYRLSCMNHTIDIKKIEIRRYI